MDKRAFLVIRQMYRESRNYHHVAQELDDNAGNVYDAVNNDYMSPGLYQALKKHGKLKHLYRCRIAADVTPEQRDILKVLAAGHGGWTEFCRSLADNQPRWIGVTNERVD